VTIARRPNRGNVRRATRGRRLPWIPAVFALSLVSILCDPLQAKLCGDDVEGHDVPCDCGDTVVSSVVLGTDPVVEKQCDGDGLIVRGMRTGALTVDLGGKTLRGSGRGTGIRVVSGAEGARVLGGGGNATISGFGDGVMATGTQPVALIQGIIVRNSARDGLRVGGDGYRIEQVESYGSGRDGFALAGRNFTIAATQAVSSGRFGYLIMGRNGRVGRTEEDLNRAILSGTDGFSIVGSGHRFVGCEALNNGRNGLSLRGVQHQISFCRAENNLDNGITGTGSAWVLQGNTTRGNHNDGLTVRGTSLIDDGGNRGSDNRGEQSHRPAVQCEIGGVPCKP
jgi:hypothetical protein